MSLVFGGSGGLGLVARLAAALGVVGLLAAALTCPAGANRSQVGSLIVSLDASFSPARVPRHRPAPVSISFTGGLQTEDGSTLPRLKGIELALASGSSRLDTRGLPICPRHLLRSATERQALERCSSALVGRGNLGARVYIPGQAPFSVLATLLAFNGGTHRARAALWLLAFSSDPPASFVLPIFVRHHPGPLSTTLTGQVPRSLGPWPHLSSFHLTLARRFTYHGSVHHYLSASCPVPPRFTGGLLPFCRARYFFVGGLIATTTVARSCHVSD
jgi:hypothetical protein